MNGQSFIRRPWPTKGCRANNDNDVLLILPSFLQSLHEKKMADNEKKFEARLDQQKSDITAQVTCIWELC
jgi:hypothetical protein